MHWENDQQVNTDITFQQITEVSNWDAVDPQKAQYACIPPDDQGIKNSQSRADKEDLFLSGTLTSKRISNKRRRYSIV